MAEIEILSISLLSGSNYLIFSTLPQDGKIDYRSKFC